MGRKRAQTNAVLSAIPAIVLLLAIVGQVVRDRAVIFGLLMYLPIVPIAVVAITWDVMTHGRSVRRLRYGPTVVGALSIGWALFVMIGSGHPPGSSAKNRINLVHWNVQWGGRDAGGWESTSAKICESTCDVVLLSEAPSGARVAELCRRLGPTWTSVLHENEPGSRYWFRLAAASRWPVRFERMVVLPNGSAISVFVDTPDKPTRFLLVDGVSDPLISRSPMLDALVAHCRAVSASGEPVDVIAGDFNALARSVGLDGLDFEGFVLASNYCGDWRGTYPASLPIYDIDHVWVGPDMLVAGCAMFSSAGTNHRGHQVWISRKN